MTSLKTHSTATETGSTAVLFALSATPLAFKLPPRNIVVFPVPQYGRSMKQKLAAYDAISQKNAPRGVLK